MPVVTEREVEVEGSTERGAEVSREKLPWARSSLNSEIRSLYRSSSRSRRTRQSHSGTRQSKEMVTQGSPVTPPAARATILKGRISNGLPQHLTNGYTPTPHTESRSRAYKLQTRKRSRRSVEWTLFNGKLQNLRRTLGAQEQNQPDSPPPRQSLGPESTKTTGLRTLGSRFRRSPRSPLDALRRVVGSLRRG